MANVLPGNQDGGRSIISYLSVVGPETDGYAVVSPDDFIPDAGTWTWTRDANGLYHLTSIAGVQTVHFALNLSKIAFNRIGTDPSIPPGGAENPAGFPGNPPGGGQPHLFRGIKIEAVDLWYVAATGNLTTLSLAFWESTFTNAAAIPTPVTKGGTLSPASLTLTAASTIYALRTTLGTPFVVDASNLANIIDYMELTLVTGASSVFSLYGAGILFDRCLN